MRRDEEEHLVAKVSVKRENRKIGKRPVLITGAVCLLAVSGICAYMAVRSDLEQSVVQSSATTLISETHLDKEAFIQAAKGYIGGMSNDTEIESCAEEVWGEVRAFCST